MLPYARTEQQLSDTLRLTQRPVAVAYPDAAPPDVERFEGSMPSTCSFWRLAGGGRAFYTVPSDHYNCPIGSYTHNIPLPPERALELDQTLGLMTKTGYLRMEEVARIPRLASTPKVVIYAPLGETPVAPDVVILSGPPSVLMVVQEAALRTGLSSTAPLMGRPTCMAVPMVEAQPLTASLGCIGNRIYTDMPDADLYLMVAGKHIQALADELEMIAAANKTLGDYHRDRRMALATS